MMALALFASATSDVDRRPHKKHRRKKHVKKAKAGNSSTPQEAVHKSEHHHGNKNASASERADLKNFNANKAAQFLDVGANAEWTRSYCYGFTGNEDGMPTRVENKREGDP